ncbi:myeloid differentiation primary response protein MyD88 [Atheta coriaria]|uniref:myeloid differentiation primary response protein MyD88 n=1 Tax=Dalotia coriaria TaxID=877792 RepID=UPI0031F46322
MAHGTSGNLYNISIKVLTTRTVKQLCDSLNTLMILPAENGLLRDWRGLSELLHIDVSVLEKQSNPTEKLLQLAQSDEQKNTIETLISCLEALDRFDVIDDYQELIDIDIRQYITIKQDSLAASIAPVCQTKPYDAMVLYAEADVDFAYDLVDVMEKNYDMRLFVKDRNLMAGDKEVQATMSVIADFSNKLIVILSPDFLTSPTNEFFLDYAQTIAIEQQTRKIIPCILTRCQIPKQLLGLHTLTYTTNSRWGCFWNKLAEAIVSRQPATSNTRILDSALTKFTTPEISQENKHQLAKCPPVSNHIIQCQTPSLQPTNSACASTSSPKLDSCDYLINSIATACNSTDVESREKSRSKKMSSFLSNVKTKLLPKSAKKKNSEKQKKKIAVAL